MKVNGYKQQNGRWIKTEFEISWYQHYYNSFYVVWQYLKSKYIN